MDLKDMILVSENYKGSEKNMLMTLEDYKKFVSIEDMSELAEHMLLLGRTLAQGEGFAEHYRAANVTVFAKFCSDDVELGRFLQGYYSDFQEFHFDKAASSPECIAKMKEIGMTEGFDVGLEMSGSQAGLHDMIHNMKHGGNIALLGLQRTDAKVDLETVIFNGLNLRGIYGRKVWDTWYKMSTMLQAGLDISPIITHHFDIKDYEKGFEAMISGESGKVILDWAHVND